MKYSKPRHTAGSSGSTFLKIPKAKVANPFFVTKDTQSILVTFEKKRELIIQVQIQLKKVFRVKSIAQKGKSQKVILSEESQKLVQVHGTKTTPF